MLNELDSAISRNPKGSIEWVVDSLSLGSLVAEIEAKPKDPELQPLALASAPQVASQFVNGIQELQTRGTLPAYFSDTAVRAVQRISRSMGKNGARAFEAVDLSANESVTVTAEATSAFKSVLEGKAESVGSIIGRLEMISIHRQPTVNIYETRTNKGVRASVPKEPHENHEQLMATIKSALGERVVASGRITRNALGEAIRLRLESLEVQRSAGLPTTDEFVGSDPDFTGTLSTEEYLRRQREA